MPKKSLIDKIRGIEALKSQKMVVDLEEISFKELLDEALVLFEERLEKKKITLKYKNDDSLDFTIKVDRVLFLNNVLNNLISNAIKFTSFNGQINIHTTTNEKNEKIISFRDNGIGIPSEIIKKYL